MKRIKVILVLLVSSMLLCSCGGNKTKCYDTVSKAFPEGIVLNIPGKSFLFLVKMPNGEIWYIETMNITNTEITTKVRLW